MKNLLAAVGVLLAVLPASAPDTALCANLLYNGGFEFQADNGRPEGWQINVMRGTKAEIGFDEEEKHGETQSLRISIKPPGGRVTLYLDKGGAAAAEPGKDYEASFWIRTRNLDYNQFHEAPAFRFNFRPRRNRPGSVIDLISQLEGASGWTRLSARSTAPPGSNRFHIDFILTSGTVWIDDVEIRPAAESAGD